MPIPTRSRSVKSDADPKAPQPQQPQRPLNHSTRIGHIGLKSSGKAQTSSKGRENSNIARPPTTFRTTSNAASAATLGAQNPTIALEKTPLKTATDAVSRVPSYNSSEPSQNRNSVQSRQQVTAVTGSKLGKINHASTTSTGVGQNNIRGFATRSNSKNDNVVINSQQNVSTGNKLPLKEGSTISPISSAEPREAMRADLLPDDRELFQLQLVYEGQHDALAKFRADACAQLLSRRQGLVEKQRSISTRVNAHTAILSKNALREWLNRIHVYENKRQIQALSATIEELNGICNSLHDTGGLLQRFQTWLDENLELQHARESLPPPPTLQFVRPLEQNWKHSIEEIMGRVELAITILQSINLPPQQAKSGLEITICRNQLLAETLFQQGQTALKLQHRIVQREETWIRQDVNSLIEQMSEDNPTVTVEHKAAWQFSPCQH